MNRPPEQPLPPYGVLIEAVREKAGLSRREAARRAGISDAWWRYVAAGWQNGPVTGTADTVAAMAHAVGVAPGDLEEEGERPDAAEALRKIVARERSAEADALPGTEDETLRQIAEFASFPLKVRRAVINLARTMEQNANGEETA